MDFSIQLNICSEDDNHDKAKVEKERRVDD